MKITTNGTQLNLEKHAAHGNKQCQNTINRLSMINV